MNVKNEHTRGSTGFYLLLVYLLFEYGRIQILLLPFLQNLYPILVITLLLLVLLLTDVPNLRYIQTRYLMALVTLMMFHVPFAKNNYWALQYAKDTLIYLIIHISIVTYIDSMEKIRNFTNILLLCSLFIGICGVLNGARIDGTSIYQDENDFSLAMNMFFPVAYFRIMGTSGKARIFFIAMTGLFILGTLVSFSRGGFMGLAVTVLYCWYKTPSKKMAILILLISIAFISYSVPPEYWEEIKTITDEGLEGGAGTGTGSERIYSWKIAWDIFLDNLIFGVGQGNFPWNFARYEPTGGFQGKMHGGRAVHSMYFQVISELGVVGIILVFSILYSNFHNLMNVVKDYKNFNFKATNVALSKINRTIEITNSNNVSEQQFKTLNYYALGIYAAFLGYLTSGIFLSVLYYPHFWLLTSLAITVNNISNKNKMPIFQKF